VVLHSTLLAGEFLNVRPPYNRGGHLGSLSFVGYDKAHGANQSQSILSPSEVLLADSPGRVFKMPTNLPVLAWWMKASDVRFRYNYTPMKRVSTPLTQAKASPR
jgi:hypothetical protein